MEYSLAFKSSVARDLKKIGKEQAKRILNKIVKELPSEAIKCPQLKGKFAGLRKYRIGNYRIIFALLEDTILIARISHRKDVYKR